MTTQSFKISDMTCSSCVMHIEELEDKLHGVDTITVNFKKHRMIAEYDESKVDSQTIAEAVTSLGYPAIPTETALKKGFSLWKR